MKDSTSTINGWKPVSQWSVRSPFVHCETAILAVPGVLSLSAQNVQTKKDCLNERERKWWTLLAINLIYRILL